VALIAHVLGELANLCRNCGIPYTWVFRWRDGTVVEIREYHTKTEALEAVGMRE